MRLSTPFAIVVAVSALCADTARAQTPVFSTGPGEGTASYFSGGTSGTAQPIYVSANTTISAFGFWAGFNTAANAKFFIFDLSTNTKVFEAVKAVGVTSFQTLVMSDPFSLLLIGGRTYNFGMIGSVVDGESTGYLSGSFNLTQGNFSNLGGNTNYGPYANLAELNVGGGAKLAMEIRGLDVTVPPPGTTVPEPGSIALMAAGLAVVGVMARRRIS